MSEQKIGVPAYVLGGLSFIPLIGVIFGLIAIIWGFMSKRRGGRWVALIGLCGILFTIIVYGSLFYLGFAVRGGVYDELRTKLAVSSLQTTVQSLEFYKTRNGAYPESLEALDRTLPQESLLKVSLLDPTLIAFNAPADGGLFLYYERVGEGGYKLLARGPDGKPFTEDDVTLNNPPAGSGLIE